MNQTLKKKKILILGPILPNNWVLIFFAGFISTSNFCYFWPDFGAFGPNLGPKNLFYGSYLN